MPITTERGAELHARRIGMNEGDRLAIWSLRNELCGTLSHDAERITLEQNRAFWAEYGASIEAWAYVARTPTETTPIGYGSIRFRGGVGWATVLVERYVHGHGYGSAILRDLCQRTTAELRATMRSDNLAALAIHRKCGGWEIIGEQDGIVTQAYRRLS